jgi:hypothetical protein
MRLTYAMPAVELKGCSLAIGLYPFEKLASFLLWRTLLQLCCKEREKCLSASVSPRAFVNRLLGLLSSIEHRTLG